MQTDPSFTDGGTAIADPIVECLNNVVNGAAQRLEYLSDNIDTEAVTKEHAAGSGAPLGSQTNEGFEKGTLNVQLNSATDPIPRPAHIIRVAIGSDEKYYVAGKFGRSRTRGEGVKGSLAVVRSYAPIVSSLLSAALGQAKKLTQAAGALTTPISDAPTVANVRTGATKAFTLVPESGYSVPAWLTISATTGALSGTAVAGHWVLRVVCTDSVAGEADRVGFGILDLTIT